MDFLFQQQARAVKLAFEEGREEEAVALADGAARLATEEIARAYHQHFLKKMEDKVRDRLGRTNIQRLNRLQQARQEAGADTGRTPTAQTIWEVYLEAWEKYIQAQPVEAVDEGLEGDQGARPSQLPNELPCWMSIRWRQWLPPSNSWCDFVFDHLFRRAQPPTWNQVHFLRTYRVMKEYWKIIEGMMGSLDDRLKGQIDRYILIAFNCDQSKEVGTKHARDIWYRGKPAFF